MTNGLFFSFHYQDLLENRINVIRESLASEKKTLGFFDASIWSEAQAKNEIGIQTLIDESLTQSSATAVLIGTNTFLRPWVRYEIFKSLEKDNKLIGIHINSVPCKNKLIKETGKNPFDYLALKFNENGSDASPCEWDGYQWVWYTKVSKWTLSKPAPQQAGRVIQLSQLYSTYDWNINKSENDLILTGLIQSR